MKSHQHFPFWKRDDEEEVLSVYKFPNAQYLIDLRQDTTCVRMRMAMGMNE